MLSRDTQTHLHWRQFHHFMRRPLVNETRMINNNITTASQFNISSSSKLMFALFKKNVPIFFRHRPKKIVCEKSEMKLIIKPEKKTKAFKKRLHICLTLLLIKICFVYKIRFATVAIHSTNTTHSVCC